MRKRPVHKINYDIKHPTLRVVGDGIAEVMNFRDAIDLAKSEGKDLIMISEGANPPVVRIEEYSKFLYKQEKQEKERKKNSTKVELKEIQLSCTIGDNDLLTKSKKSIEFLEEGNKVKCVIRLLGRQRSMPAAGELVMLKFAEMSSEVGTPESMPKLDSNKWIMILKPKKS